MTLRDYIEKYSTLREMPPLCIFQILVKNNDKILWIDPDANRKNCFFFIVKDNGEVIRELSFQEFYNEIEYFISNGWNNRDCFIDKDIKLWANEFAEKYGIKIL